MVVRFGSVPGASGVAAVTPERSESPRGPWDQVNGIFGRRGPFGNTKMGDYLGGLVSVGLVTAVLDAWLGIGREIDVNILST